MKNKYTLLLTVWVIFGSWLQSQPLTPEISTQAVINRTDKLNRSIHPLFTGVQSRYETFREIDTELRIVFRDFLLQQPKLSQE